jgi:hypothetical protein
MRDIECSNEKRAGENIFISKINTRSLGSIRLHSEQFNIYQMLLGVYTRWTEHLSCMGGPGSNIDWNMLWK